MVLSIEKNDKEYAKLLKSPDADGLGGYIDDKGIRALPRGARIVTGEKPGFGGGPSPDGFVVAINGKLLARVKLKGNPAVHGDTLAVR